MDASHSEGNHDLELLIVECTDRMASEGPRVLEELCESHPDLAVDLRRAVQRLMRSGLVELPEVVPGARLGEYEVLREIGRGGMGVVVEANDPRLERHVALKVLRGHEADLRGKGLEEISRRSRGERSLLTRFLEEAQIGGQLEHPGVVPVHDIGVANGQLFFAMKMIRGKALAEILRERSDPRAERGRLLSIFEAVCQTVAYAHSRGFAHRDLKPANVMVGEFGEVQVVDWGLAKFLHGREEKARSEASPNGGADPEGSAAGTVLGTPKYMPPEQARGEVDRLDERCDVFALGALLCEVLTGEPPWIGRTRDEVLERARRGNVSEISDRLGANQVDPELVSLALDCLAPVPEKRPANGLKVASRMSEHLLGVEERARQAQLEAARAQARVESERRARRLTAALAVSIVLSVALAAGGWSWYADSQRAEQRETEERIAARLDDASQAASRAAWSEALVAVESARALAQPRKVSEELCMRVGERLVLVRAAEQAALDRARLDERNESLLRDLEEVRQPEGDEFYPRDWVRVDEEISEVFAKHGLHPLAEDSSAALRELRARGRGKELAAHLDGWSAVCRSAELEEHALRLRHFADELDGDPARAELRHAIVEENLAVLIAFAGREDLAQQPATTLQLLGRALRDGGERERALEVFSAAMRDHRGDFALLLGLGRTLAKQDPPRFAESARALEAALALRPDSVEVRHELARHLHQELGEHEAAVTLLGEALTTREDDAHLWWHLALARGALGRYAEALEASAKSIALDGDFAPAHITHGHALNELGRFAEAEQPLRWAISLDPSHRTARSNLFTSQRLGVRPEKALTNLRRSIVENPDDPLPLWNLGICLTDSGETEDALAAFEDALALEPDNPKLLYDYACAQMDVGRYAEAARTLIRSVELDPDHGLAFANLGMSLRSSGNRTAARLALLAALDRDPQIWNAHDSMGGILYEIGDFEGAERSYRRACEIVPTNAICLHNLGRALQKLGRAEEAIAAFEESLDFDACRAVVSYELGMAHYGLKQVEAAAAAFRSAAEQDHTYAEAWCNLGHMLWELGRLKEALDALERGHELGSQREDWGYASDAWISDLRAELEKGGTGGG